MLRFINVSFGQWRLILCVAYARGLLPRVRLRVHTVDASVIHLSMTFLHGNGYQPAHGLQSHDITGYRINQAKLLGAGLSPRVFDGLPREPVYTGQDYGDMTVHGWTGHGHL